ncbi:hypothetical protein C8R43DRAFT_1142155, partial [Mycena crocata]
MADSRPTDMEFFPDSRNFDSQKEHDESKRKINEALNWEENHSQDGVIPALTMKQALKILDSHTKPPKVKKEVKTEPEIKPEPAELKRGVDTPSPKRPLYTDDEDDEDEDADRVAQPVDTFEDHNHASRQKEVAQDGSQPRPRGKPALRGKRARAGATPPPNRPPSPTISSVSSLSTGSSIPGSASTASHAFRNLGESASTARRGGVRTSNPRAAVPARTSPPATRPSRRGSTVPHAAAPPSARHDPTVHVGPGAAAALRSLACEPMKYKPVELKDLVEGAASASTSSSAAGERARLLWNHAQRTVYKDTAMAVQEMQPKETVQVVDLEDLVEYVSGKAPAAFTATTFALCSPTTSSTLCTSHCDFRIRKHACSVKISLASWLAPLLLTTATRVGRDEDEDEEEQLPQAKGLGNTSHRSRDPSRPVIPVRKHRAAAPGKNVRATATKRREQHSK